MNIKIADTNNMAVAGGAVCNITVSNSTIAGIVMVDANACKLWWPTGLGAAKPIYVTVSIIGDGNRTLSSITKCTGFRTVVLNMDPISQAQLEQGVANGNNWHFEINEHDFYVNDSNFILPDAFWLTVTEASIQQLF